MYKVEHPYYGELVFRKKPDPESKCFKCIHTEVCHHNRSRLCVNHERKKDLINYYPEYCTCCEHWYTSADSGEGKKIPCFVCRQEIPNDKVDRKGYKTYKERNQW